FGVFRVPVVWAIGSYDGKKTSADVEVAVERLPKGIKSGATVRVMFAVDEQGRPSSCIEEPTPGISKKNLQLVPLACEQLLKFYTAVPAKNDAGVSVRSVQNALVSFIRR
ncbi:MAG: hypothetical protein LC672_06175, partial [Acidobacteria bacterium]|nr:hypothetical protein [Acidobacteriota bacterium]